MAAGVSVEVVAPGDGRPHAVVVRGIDAGTLDGGSLSRALRVFAGQDGEERGLPAVAGALDTAGGALRFRPRFPFVPGVRYVARVAAGGVSLSHVFEVQAPPGDPPRVLGVFPSGTDLPENALRLYVVFSRPMRQKDTTRLVRLVDAEGRTDPLAFVPVDQGLWDPAGTRLTLLLHPGRVKRGVAGGELGPPLRAGGAYALVVDGTMASAAGTPLGADFVRRFRASAADRETPRAAAIEVRPPAAPHAPVAVVFGEPLDHGLLQRLVWVEDAEGRAVEGEAQVDEGETRWTFRPQAPWGGVGYAVRVSPALEDRAGNRFDRPFDREEGARAAVPPALRLPFAVSPPADP